jgi:hypothetical protein
MKLKALAHLPFSKSESASWNSDSPRSKEASNATIWNVPALSEGHAHTSLESNERVIASPCLALQGQLAAAVE